MFKHTAIAAVLLAVCGFGAPPCAAFVTHRNVVGTTLRMADASETPAPAPAANTDATTQSKYGVSIDMPSTYARCGRCDTSFALAPDDLGNGRGRRLECSVCGHTWYQSKDRLSNMNGGFEIIDLPETDLQRIANNIEEGRSPKFVGEMKLYVGNIAFTCTEQDMQEAFSEAGDVGEVSLVRDDEGRNRGFGFITMRTKEGGEKAIELLDGASVNGRNIAVRPSNN